MRARRRSRNRNPQLGAGATDEQLKAHFSGDATKITFGSLMEMMEQAKKPECGKMGRESRSAGGYNGLDWFGGITWDETVKHVDSGWAEGTAKAIEFLEALRRALPPVNHQVTMEMADAPGAFIDIDTYLTGEPEHWVDFTPDRQQPRPVTIKVVGNIAGAVPTEALINRGCALAAIIDILEARNFRVQLDVCYCSGARNGNAYFEIETRIKELSQPLDLDALVFCLAHPATPRRIVFGVRETMPQAIRKTFGFGSHGGYGQSISVRDRENVDLYLPNLTSSYTKFLSVESTTDWIVETLRKSNFLDEEELRSLTGLKVEA